MTVKFLLTYFFLALPFSSAWPKFDFEIRRDSVKISYERRVYESVDDKRLSKAISQTLTIMFILNYIVSIII